jgi:hypothetical protein
MSTTTTEPMTDVAPVVTGKPVPPKLGETTPMNEYAELGGNGKKTMLPLIEGTAGERAIDISKLRALDFDFPAPRGP